jgi:hypothetical protein
MTLSPHGATDLGHGFRCFQSDDSDSGNISLFRPSCSTSIIVGNGSTLPVTTFGYSIIPGPFYLNNILVASDIVQNLIFVRQFNYDNNCSVEFDPLGLSVKDFHSRSVIARYNSSEPLYTLAAPTCSPVSCALVATIFSTTWHRCLGNPGHEALSKLTSTSVIGCNNITSDSICHACQVGRHTRLPFANSTSRALKNFDLIHCDLWTSPISSVFGYKYYLTILDDCSHFLWTSPPRLKSETFTTLANFFSYVKAQFDCTIRSILRDNGRCSTTLPPAPSFSLMVFCSGCHAPTRPPKPVKSGV